MSGRPRIAIGTYGSIHVVQKGRGRFTAHTRYRDTDGCLRQVKATSNSRGNAVSELKTRLLTRPGYGRGGMLSLTSPFGDLAELWLADLAQREISEGTKQNYRDDLRVHVRPFFENYTLGEITTGRVETFLKAELLQSYSRAKHARTMLNLLFGFALRHDAIARNPVEGTSSLRKPKGSPESLTLDQVQRIRDGAALWRTGPGVKGPGRMGATNGWRQEGAFALGLSVLDHGDGDVVAVARLEGERVLLGLVDGQVPTVQRARVEE